MSTEYLYERELVDGAYNIDNLLRVDGEGNQIHLGKEIKDVFTTNNNCVCCNGSELKITFEDALSAEEITTLEGIITAHKNNT